jgi:hypothetical protein
MVGDDNVSGYAAFDYMSGYNYKNGGSVIDGKYTIGSVPRGLPVTTLSWIKAKILDVGFDVAFLDNRLTSCSGSSAVSVTGFLHLVMMSCCHRKSVSAYRKKT